MAPEYYSIETLLISILCFVYENTVIYATRIVGGLKEDATVEIPTTLTLTQLLLFWMLMGLLLTWMIVFALLALKPETGKKSEPDAPGATSFPQLHIIVQQQAQASPPETQLVPTPVSTSKAKL